MTRLMLCAVVPAALLALAPTAHADPTPQPLRGDYVVTFHVDQKTGTSAAASQFEVAYKRNYAFTSDCGADGCTATVTQGAPAKVDGSPQPLTESSTFAWETDQWVQNTRWQWDCQWPDGTVEWNPASSRVSLRPNPDGSLDGVFSSDISRGVCAGTVNIPVTVVPA